MRKLVTLRKISEVNPIEGADSVEEFIIDGWSIVNEKNSFKVGDTVLYFECDAFLPCTDDRFQKYLNFKQNLFDGKKGHRVKTKKIRGIFSQGIIMSVETFPEITELDFEKDYSDILGIIKFEKPEDEEEKCVSESSGSFPSFLRKSDQSRIQNETRLYFGNKDELFVGTLKMDGVSITVAYVDTVKYNREQPYVICSKNRNLKYNPEEDFENQSKFYQGAFRSDLFSKVKKLHDLYDDYFAIQGELVGPGIQGNFEKITEYKVFAYNIFNITKQKYVSYAEFSDMAKAINLEIVPIIYEPMPILQYSIKEIVKMSDGPGYLAPYREGIVWKSTTTQKQFKAISNKYLEKEV